MTAAVSPSDLIRLERMVREFPSYEYLLKKNIECDEEGATRILTTWIEENSARLGGDPCESLLECALAGSETSPRAAAICAAIDAKRAWGLAQSKLGRFLGREKDAAVLSQIGTALSWLALAGCTDYDAALDVGMKLVGSSSDVSRAVGHCLLVLCTLDFRRPDPFAIPWQKADVDFLREVDWSDVKSRSFPGRFVLDAAKRLTGDGRGSRNTVGGLLVMQILVELGVSAQPLASQSGTGIDMSEIEQAAHAMDLDILRRVFRTDRLFGEQ